ncbi:hypothetical protein ACJ2A9_12585 [Anaerobacillus sp. MEB173]|uniref:hypothetical protein n=1 Tax=Anaerobacillus sp. MEB173 TaxID=3383345 RepID=UPI003F8DE4D2
MSHRRRFNKYRYPLWLRRIRDACYQFVLPLIIFQVIRLLLFPTTLDVLILLFLTFLYTCFLLGWI